MNRFCLDSSLALEAVWWGKFHFWQQLFCIKNVECMKSSQSCRKGGGKRQCSHSQQKTAQHTTDFNQIVRSPEVRTGMKGESNYHTFRLGGSALLAAETKLLVSRAQLHTIVVLRVTSDQTNCDRDSLVTALFHGDEIEFVQCATETKYPPYCARKGTRSPQSFSSMLFACTSAARPQSSPAGRQDSSYCASLLWIATIPVFPWLLHPLLKDQYLIPYTLSRDQHAHTADVLLKCMKRQGSSPGLLPVCL